MEDDSENDRIENNDYLIVLLESIQHAVTSSRSWGFCMVFFCRERFWS